MIDVLEFSMNDLQLFLLCMFRIGGVMSLAPLFGGEAIPARVRAMTTFVIAILFFPMFDHPDVLLPQNLGIFFTSVLLETGLGLMIGFSSRLLFTAAQFAGQMVDQELGLAMANIIDPVTNQQVSVIGEFKMFLGLIIWLLLFGHHFVIRATFDSFQAMPLFTFAFHGEPALFIADTMMRQMFVTAVTIAAPAVVTLFLVTIAMAFMARVVPEMNIFILGFSLRIMVGLLFLTLAVGVFANTFVRQSQKHEDQVRELMEVMRAASAR